MYKPGQTAYQQANTQTSHEKVTPSSSGRMSFKFQMHRNIGNQAMAASLAGRAASAKSDHETGEMDIESRSALQAGRGHGESLDETTKTFMEASLGTNLDRVRIHRDASAETLTQSLGAEAATFGRHVYFNSGRYRPDNLRGTTLLAHELVHTVQQGFYDGQVPTNVGVSKPQDPSERQADAIAHNVIGNATGNQNQMIPIGNVAARRIQPKIQMAKTVDVGLYETKDHGEGYEDAPSETFKLEANSIKEAGTKVNALTEAIGKVFDTTASIKQLSFYGHAAPGNQSVGAGEGDDADRQITVSTINSHQDDFKRIYAPLAGGANVYLRGCNAGAGDSGLALLKKIKTSCKELVGTDIEAYGWTGKSYHQRRWALMWFSSYQQTGQLVSSSDKAPKITWEKLKKKNEGSE
jgi:hypothetical protein